MNKYLSAGELSSLLVGIGLMDIENILSVVLMGISVVLGLINIIISIRKALKDGKITKEEKQEILDEIKENFRNE